MEFNNLDCLYAQSTWFTKFVLDNFYNEYVLVFSYKCTWVYIKLFSLKTNFPSQSSRRKTHGHLFLNNY